MGPVAVSGHHAPEIRAGPKARPILPVLDHL